jgi:hypothetical protein
METDRTLAEAPGNVHYDHLLPIRGPDDKSSMLSDTGTSDVKASLSMQRFLI